MAEIVRPAVLDHSKKDEPGFVRAIGLFDGTMIVVGSMIGSGIFIVAADISRVTGSPGGLLLTWIITGLLTISAALAYGELAALFPHAGGQYVYLREAYSPLWGFLYGWTLFLVIQTGTIAAVAVGFARYLGVLFSCDFTEYLDHSSDFARFETGDQSFHSAIRGHSDDYADYFSEHAGCAPGQADPKHFYLREDAFLARTDLDWRVCRQKSRRDRR